ncbi:hypothetical protein RHOFW104T7_11365 [Rhodanobacter thiooxydans]|uniref:Uncharacterized protein n=1 Tax=Rhodanobacter thiooxydans TaxID=416169 RepID=A0A154QI70_9GAMM|nr:hypothetical protein [Rhodanobacter thiooxydans]EIL97887.1 hypothetical protein UUA_13740 [Rhodanobacter thiooxydans LCS2]KZC23863.1 hypothetical protein RHOFW104T7_11365 [Rhodanobacter thiooxydans]MCW0202292.1 hypothetical protein [Rhodanobacter thiooxydans]
MMHPSIRPSAPPVPASMAVPESLQAAADDVDETPPLHADYNLRRLVVDSLEHYLLPAGEDGERFRVR